MAPKTGEPLPFSLFERSGIERVALNRSERMYLGIEGVSGSLTQVYAVRLGAPVSAADVKAALKQVVLAHPRLRAVVEPTLLGHRLRVHPPGRTVDTLFDLAFREEPLASTDDEALAELMGRLLGEPFAVERDLPIKARYVPHATKPAVLLSMHHIAGDGRSVMGWIKALHRALDGETLTPVALDPPGQLAAIVPPSLRDVPRALLEEARAIASAPSRPPHLVAPREAISGYGPTAVLPHRLSSPGSALVAAARSRGTTVGTLLFSAAALAFHRLVPSRGDEVVRARLSIDLRELYPKGRGPGDGNYVSSFVVDVDPRAELSDILAKIDADTRASIERFQKHTMMMTTLARETVSWMGRHQTARTALLVKRLGRHTMQSFHLSNLGRVEGFDGGKVPFDCVFPSLPHPDLMIGVLGFRGSLQVVFMYPCAEVAPSFVRSLATTLDEIAAELVAQDARGASARARASN